MRLIKKGRSDKEIAADHVLSEKTVKTHVSNLLGKLALADRTQAALRALRASAPALRARARWARYDSA